MKGNAEVSSRIWYGMRARLFSLLLGANGLALVAWQSARWRACRQISGRLSFVPEQVPAATYRVGQFLVAWQQRDGGRLVISHQECLERVLWASLPGESFVGAAQGFERVRE